MEEEAAPSPHQISVSLEVLLLQCVTLAAVIGELVLLQQVACSAMSTHPAFERTSFQHVRSTQLRNLSWPDLGMHLVARSFNRRHHKPQGMCGR